MTLDITQAAKEHIIKLGYDAAYGARPLRRDDPEPDRGPARRAPAARPVQPGRHDRGRRRSRRQGPEHRGHRGEDPGRSLTGGRGAVAWPAPRAGTSASPAARPSCAGRASAARAASGTPSSRPSSATSRARGSRRRRSPGRRRARRRCPRPATRRGSAGRSASASWTGSWAAGWSPGRSCCSAASPASASPRSCSRSRPGIARTGGPGAVRHRRGVGRARSGCAPRASAWPRDPSARRCGSSRRRASGGSTELARARLPGLLVVDSVQTVASEELDGPPGSVGQVRESTLRLMELAKGEGVPVVLVGHVTKDGTLAGPKTLEHLVDVVLSSRATGPAACASCARRRTGTGRPRRSACSRWGSAASRRSPTRPGRSSPSTTARRPGSVVAPVLEGSPAAARRGPGAGRPAGAPAPRAHGVGRRPQPARAPGRRARAARGDRPRQPRRLRQPRRRALRREPGLDLPLALALASSLRDRPVVPGTVAIGEVGLLGELRAVGGLDRRLREAARLGFARAIVPRRAAGTAQRPAASRSSRSGSLADAVAPGPERPVAGAAAPPGRASGRRRPGGAC